MNSLFCRHNRFTADCPICSKGTPLDESARRAQPRPRRRATGTARSRTQAPAARSVTGPYVSAGPYERPDGATYEVRLERVPGGLRLAEWASGAIARSAPVLRGADLRALVAAAPDRAVLAGRDLDALERALAAAPGHRPPADAFGASPGRAGLLRDELRAERLDEGMVRLARWVLRPNSGWELQQAPVMLPAARFAEALARAVESGLI